MPASPHPVRRLPALDLLRFIAALLVVLFHYSGKLSEAAPHALVQGLPREMMKYGYLGVSLFFMISGFVIPMSMQGSAAEFLRARFLRLWPAFFICASITALVLLAQSGGAEPRALRYLANLTMVPAILRQPALDIVYWTLTLELKFYAWMALLLALGVAPRIRPWAWAWMGIAAIHLLVARLPLAEMLFFPAWAPHFAGGALVLAARRDGLRPGDALLYLACAALACRLAWLDTAAGAAHLGEPLSGAVAALLTGLLFAAFALLAHPRIAQPAKGAWARTAALCGALSYPLYLIHDEIGRRLLARFGEHAAEAPLTAIFLACGGAVALAWAIWRYGEEPLRKRLQIFLGQAGPLRRPARQPKAEVAGAAE